jgi:hypothetical protein
MACGHLLGTLASSLDLARPGLNASRSVWAGAAHLDLMDQTTSQSTLEVLSLPELAERPARGHQGGI